MLSIDLYIERLNTMMNIEKGDGYVIIYNGSQKHKYNYIDLEDLRKFVVSYYIDNIFDGEPMCLREIGILYGVSKNAIHKTIKNVMKKISIYSHML